VRLSSLCIRAPKSTSQHPRSQIFLEISPDSSLTFTEWIGRQVSLAGPPRNCPRIQAAQELSGLLGIQKASARLVHVFSKSSVLLTMAIRADLPECRQTKAHVEMTGCADRRIIVRRVVSIGRTITLIQKFHFIFFYRGVFLSRREDGPAGRLVTPTHR
jgi:hypothetical protein